MEKQKNNIQCYIFTIKKRKIASSFFSFLGVFWASVKIGELFNFSVEKLVPNMWFLFIVILFLSILVNLPKLKISSFISNTSVKISVQIGNILELKGNNVIATNTTYDTTLEDIFISPSSLQGQFQEKFFSDIKILDKELEKSLAECDPIDILNRTKSKCRRYNKGTIAKLKIGSYYSYWLALADVNEHGKPEIDMDDLLMCLDGLWDYL